MHTCEVYICTVEYASVHILMYTHAHTHAHTQVDLEEERRQNEEIMAQAKILISQRPSKVTIESHDREHFLRV